jgi:hypothetical protein
MAFWVEGFRRDAHPTREIGWWEHVAACYLEFASRRQLTREQSEAVFAALTAYASSATSESTTTSSSALTIEDIDDLKRLARGELQIDIDDPDETYWSSGPTWDVTKLPGLIAGDVEEFPESEDDF